MNKIKIYIKSIAIPVIIGGIVGFAISSSIDYNSLERPFLSPPSIAFPIVWSILYLFILVNLHYLQSITGIFVIFTSLNVN